MNLFYNKTDDQSLWLTSGRVRGYLNRADKIPHRTEGEQVLLDFIPKKIKRVLDLGTGDGRMITLLKEKIPTVEYFALDFSPHMLGKDNLVNIVQHDLNFPLPKMGYFDGVISCLAIHHLTNSRKQALYSELFSMLKPRGILCNFDHFASTSVSLTQQFRRKMGRQRAPNPDHERRLTSVEIQIEWLKQTGYVDVDCYWKWLQFALLICFKPTTNNS